ncbi:MAG TPA: Lrp/AsnC family transcriptional regulator [Candidatus Thermoplasmatota archaeon]|nr:Lrp/AsnC family transcriptional regulator [Candidatus Thermoplasmatota archaeon]
MSPILTDANPQSRFPIDLIGKRILGRLSSNVSVDIQAIAKDIGASEEVVRERLGAMRTGGLLQGFEVRLDATLLDQTYEFLVSGAPSDGTDRQAIAMLCSTAGVTRVFALASAHGVAFTVVGTDPATTRTRGLALAEAAGLRQPQVILIVNTFRDQAGFTPMQGPVAA